MNNIFYCTLALSLSTAVPGTKMRLNKIRNFKSKTMGSSPLCLLPTHHTSYKSENKGKTSCTVPYKNERPGTPPRATCFACSCAQGSELGIDKEN